MPGAVTTDPCVEDIRRWLERMGTACGFAQHLARNALVYYLVVPDRLTPEWVRAINVGLDEAAADKKTGIIVFPHIYTSNEIAETIVSLTSSHRWRAHWTSTTSSRRSLGHLRLAWETPHGHRRETSAMGLAPLRSMPQTRRAPYAAIVLWPGARENRRASIPDSPSDPVGLVDARHGMNDKEYGHHWSTTIRDVRTMSQFDGEDPRLLRDVAFRLPQVVLQRYFSAPATRPTRAK